MHPRNYSEGAVKHWRRSLPSLQVSKKDLQRICTFDVLIEARVSDASPENLDHSGRHIQVGNSTIG